MMTTTVVIENKNNNKNPTPEGVGKWTYDINLPNTNQKSLKLPDRSVIKNSAPQMKCGENIWCIF